MVVDPPRDIDRVITAAARRGVRVTHVVETHVHDDYVTGGLEPARLTGAACLVPAAARVGYERVPVAETVRRSTTARRGAVRGGRPAIGGAVSGRLPAGVLTGAFAVTAALAALRTLWPSASVRHDDVPVRRDRVVRAGSAASVDWAAVGPFAAAAVLGAS